MADNFYKTGSSYYNATTNQKILNLNDLQTLAKAGGKEIQAPTPNAGSVAIPNPQAIGNYNVTNNIGGTLYGTPKIPTVLPAATLTQDNSSLLAAEKAKNQAIQVPQFDNAPAYDETAINAQLDKIKVMSAPNEEVTTLGKQAADKQAEIGRLADAYTQGQNYTENQVIPMEFITGQLASNEKRYLAQKQQLSNEEQNLITRLGLAKESQQAQLEAEKLGLTSMFQVAGLKQQAQDRINQNKMQVFNAALQLNETARQTLATILDKFQGVDPDKLAAEGTAQLQTLAQQSGIPFNLIIAGMRAVKDQIDFSNQIKQQEVNFDQSYKLANLELDRSQFASDQAYKEAQVALDKLKLSSPATGEMNSKQLQTFLSISNKYQADEIIKNYDNAKSAVAVADQVLSDPGKATNQLKSLYLLVKNLDPTSAVREGELSLAQSTQSYFDQFTTSITRIGKGQALSPKAAAELAQATKDLVGTWGRAKDARTQRYTSQANTAGIGQFWGNYLGGSETITNNLPPLNASFADIDGLLKAVKIKYGNDTVNQYIDKIEEMQNDGLSEVDILHVLTDPGGFNEVGGDTYKATSYLSNYGPITGKDGSEYWKWGLDVDLQKGDKVFSPVDGTVVKVGKNGNFGNQIQIKTSKGNLVWLSHLDGFTAKVGDQVKTGQVVGVGGNTGKTIALGGGDGSHLDITVKKPNGSYYTPQEIKRILS